VNVVSRLIGPTDSEPDVGRSPLHPPEALQPFARLEDHVSVTRPPLETDVLEAVRETLGVLPSPCAVFEEPLLPLQALRQAASNTTASSAGDRVSNALLRVGEKWNFTYWFSGAGLPFVAVGDGIWVSIRRLEAP